MTDLWPHQRAAMDFARPRPAALLGMGMGAGKSATAVRFADEIEAARILILCPTTVRAVWRREIPKHSRRDVGVTILDTGSVGSRTRRADRAILSSGPVCLVFNYEASWRPPFCDWALARHWDLVILDESQRIQREGRAARFCADLHRTAERRLCLTGTPLTQDPMSVWAQCRFLDPSVFGDDLHWFLWRYENRYAVGARKAVAKLNELRAMAGKPAVEFSEDDLRGTINTAEYLYQLSQIAFRCESAVLNLPPLRIERRLLQLSRQARMLYDAIQAGYIAEIESGRWPDVRGSFAVTMRLQQITSGYLPCDGEAVAVDQGKAECLADLLDMAGGEPIVVFTRFVRDLDTTQAAADRLNLRYAEISQRRKDGINELAQMPEWCQVVGVQEQAGAGIDLSRARLAVDYSPGWSLANWEQKVARLHRPPQNRPVVVYQLIDEETVDEEIRRALDARRRIVGQVWNDLAFCREGNDPCTP